MTVERSRLTETAIVNLEMLARGEPIFAHCQLLMAAAIVSVIRDYPRTPPSDERSRDILRRAARRLAGGGS